MTIKVNRLATIMSKLTVEERFDAILDAYRTGRPVALSIAVGLPHDEATRWNRLVGLFDATHRNLGWYVSYVDATVTQVELRFGILLGFHLAFLHDEEKLMDLALDPDAEVRRTHIRARMTDLEKKVELLAKVIAAQLESRWLEVRLAEIGAEALMHECAGRDIVHPDMKATLLDCKARLSGITESLTPWAEARLAEPEEAQVEQLLELLEKEAER